jgi:hypothetical protein
MALMTVDLPTVVLDQVWTNRDIDSQKVSDQWKVNVKESSL